MRVDGQSKKYENPEDLWYNLDFGRQVPSKVGKFNAVLDRRFLETYLYHRIFNKYTAKVSYALPNKLKYNIHKYNDKSLHA